MEMDSLKPAALVMGLKSKLYMLIVQNIPYHC